MTRKEPTKEGMIAGSVVMWTVLVIVLGTLVGVWIRWFWIGWVLADLLR